jgi:hypothetical protein
MQWGKRVGEIGEHEIIFRRALSWTLYMNKEKEAE